MFRSDVLSDLTYLEMKTSPEISHFPDFYFPLVLPLCLSVSLLYPQLPAHNQGLHKISSLLSLSLSESHFSLSLSLFQSFAHTQTHTDTRTHIYTHCVFLSQTHLSTATHTEEQTLEGLAPIAPFPPPGTG